MYMNSYKSFYTSVKSLTKKTSKLVNNRVNKVNVLYSVSSLNETPVFFTYQQRESLNFNSVSKEATSLFYAKNNNSFLINTFASFATTSFFKSKFNSKDQANVSCFNYSLYFIQQLGFRGAYQVTNYSTNYNPSTYFYYRFILKYFFGQSISTSINFARRERFLYLSVLFSISQTSQFRSITPVFINLLNKFFATTKQKPSAQSRKVVVSKALYFPKGLRRNPVASKRLSNIFTKANVSTSSRFNFFNLYNKFFSIGKTGRFNIASYPRNYEGFVFQFTKLKKIKKVKKVYKSPKFKKFSSSGEIKFFNKDNNEVVFNKKFNNIINLKKFKKVYKVSDIKKDYSFAKVKKASLISFKKSIRFVSFKGNSSFLKSQYSEVKPYSYTLKLFATNQNKGLPQYYGFSHLKSLLSLISGNRFSIYTVNALSLSRFAFDKERFDARARFRSDSKNKSEFDSQWKVKKSYRFLRNLERERLWRFRYVAVYIQNLIRISFFSIFLKKSTFLVSFFAFTLSKLPRNRKETQFLRFLRKLVKVFASQREEVLGVRIRFQGRVNRWRRTKHIVGEKGSIALQTYSTYMDYGRAQAITRKGALGIRFWIVYRPSFKVNLSQTRIYYLQLPKLAKFSKILNYNNIFI